jgi:hypothetical protein
MRLAELGEAGGGIAYPAVSVAIKRFEKRLQVDRDLRRKLGAVEKLLKIQTRPRDLTTSASPTQASVERSNG